ncbi:MAG: SUMF1/EgtB/PvdO family nonheme iron enzyme [Mariprofundales bacterium]
MNVFVLFLLIFFMPAITLAASNYALVIGNNTYHTTALLDAVTHAQSIKTALEQQGFSVLYRENLHSNNIKPTLDAFYALLKKDITNNKNILVYYSGHALQLHGSNYLLSVDANLTAAADVPANSINMSKLLLNLENITTAKIVLLLDSSRKTIVVRQLRVGVPGMAKVLPISPYSLVSYAAIPGKEVPNKVQKHGWYAQEINKMITNIGMPTAIDLQNMMEKVHSLSNGMQSPWLAHYTPPEKTPKHMTKVSTEFEGIDMVYLQAGKFMMGSNDDEVGRYRDEHLHSITIPKGFWMQIHEVTFAQYDAFCAATGYPKAADSGWGRGNQPIINIPWFSAAAFANWVSGQTGHYYRLPTEAEWEYAARAGSQTAFSFGNDVTMLENYAWNGEWALGRTHPVGSKKSNAWGLYDMHGNVWEWTSSVYNPDYNGSEIIDSSLENSLAMRVARGGSWYFYPKALRSADRRSYNPKFRVNYIGFRLVRVE